VILLDTPGFDSTNVGNLDVLDDIADYMKKTWVVFTSVNKSLTVCSATREKSYLLEYCTSMIYNKESSVVAT
jgi:hypothetical protein